MSYKPVKPYASCRCVSPHPAFIRCADSERHAHSAFGESTALSVPRTLREGGGLDGSLWSRHGGRSTDDWSRRESHEPNERLRRAGAVPLWEWVIADAGVGLSASGEDASLAEPTGGGCAVRGPETPPTTDSAPAIDSPVEWPPARGANGEIVGKS